MDGNEQYFHRSPEDEGFPVFNQTVSAVTGCPYAARLWMKLSTVLRVSINLKIVIYQQIIKKHPSFLLLLKFIMVLE